MNLLLIQFCSKLFDVNQTKKALFDLNLKKRLANDQIDQ